MGGHAALLALIGQVNELQSVIAQASQQLQRISRSAHDMLAASLTSASAPSLPAPITIASLASTSAPSPPTPTTALPSSPLPRRTTVASSSSARKQLATKGAVRSTPLTPLTAQPPASARQMPTPPTAAELEAINRVDERFEVKEAGAPYVGLGLFARTALGADELLLRYEGEHLNDAEAAERYGTDRSTGRPTAPPQYVMQPKAGLYIDATHQPRALARYINHAPRKKANARYTVNGTVRSNKRIAAGQQVTASYGPEAVRALRSAGLLPPAPRKRKRSEETATTNADAASLHSASSVAAAADLPQLARH